MLEKVTVTQQLDIRSSNSSEQFSALLWSFTVCITPFVCVCNIPDKLPVCALLSNTGQFTNCTVLSLQPNHSLADIQ